MRNRTVAKRAVVLAVPAVIDIATPLATVALLSAGAGLLARRAALSQPTAWSGKTT